MGVYSWISQSTGLRAPAQVPTSPPPPHPQYLALRLDIPALGLLEFMEAGLEEAAAALGHRYREGTLSRLIEAGRRHTGSPPAPCPLTVACVFSLSASLLLLCDACSLVSAL